MPAHFAIREGTSDKAEADEATHEWVALIGGNGETWLTSETYPIGHGDAARSLDRLAVELPVALGQPVSYKPYRRP